MVLPVLILEYVTSVRKNVALHLSIPDPLGDGAVLLLLLRKLALDAEGLESGHDLLEYNLKFMRALYLFNGFWFGIQDSHNTITHPPIVISTRSS